jgi:hypothetical protein
VPAYVNDCLTHLLRSQRPVVLLDRLATPSELLTWQSSGLRCVTCLLSPSDLSAPHTDFYPPFATKDALHFAIHDLQHLDKFTDPAFYAEQVGFLHRMKPVRAFAATSGGSALAGKELRKDVGHAISDMNANSVHMQDFVTGRWAVAGRRAGAEADPEVGEVLRMLTDGFQGDQRSADDVRKGYRAIGCERLAASAGCGVAEMEAHWPFVVPAGRPIFFRGAGGDKVRVRRAREGEEEASAGWPVWTCKAMPDPAGSFKESEWWVGKEGVGEERCFVTQGAASLILEGGLVVQIQAGDWVVFLKGFAGRWEVDEDIAKRYAYYLEDGGRYNG